MNPRRNEIYMASVEFADKPESKSRPVVVISSNHYNENHPDVIVCGMTTNSTHDCSIMLTATDFEDGDFYPGSVIRYDTIQRIAKDKFQKRVGKMTNEFHNKLVEKIAELIK